MDVPGVTSCHVKTVIITSTPWVLVLGTPTAATKQILTEQHYPVMKDSRAGPGTHDGRPASICVAK